MTRVGNQSSNKYLIFLFQIVIMLAYACELWRSGSGFSMTDAGQIAGVF